MLDQRLGLIDKLLIASSVIGAGCIGVLPC